MHIFDTKRGGFGRVEFVQEEDGCSYAKKILDPKPEILSETDPTKLHRRFSREVKIQASLSPTLFMPIISSSLDDVPPWFTMPLATENFRQFIERKRLTHELTIFIDPLCDILNSLEALHELDYKHRDLKPENILFHENKWKLSDLGLVGLSGSATSMLTSRSSAWGTAQYTSPEQLLDFAHVTCSTDIFSFGCILHDIFEGGDRLPYQQLTGMGLIGVVIEKCTEPQASKRFKDIAGLRSALVMALQTPGTVSTSMPAEAWIDRIGKASLWNSKDYDEFTQYLRRPLSAEDRKALFFAVTEDFLRAVHSNSETVWTLITELYCNEAEGEHKFAYCDIVGSRLRLVAELGGLSIRARATIVAARVACLHNRWFVMRIVMKLASPAIEDNLARRLAVEIKATQTEEDFILCASSHDIDDLACYHSIVREAIIAP